MTDKISYHDVNLRTSVENMREYGIDPLRIAGIVEGIRVWAVYEEQRRIKRMKDDHPVPHESVFTMRDNMVEAGLFD